MTDALPWEDMDPDVLECGDPQATHALYVKMLRSRAAQARKIAHEQKQAAADCLEGAQTFAAHALDFDALATALEKPPTSSNPCPTALMDSMKSSLRPNGLFSPVIQAAPFFASRRPAPLSPKKGRLMVEQVDPRPNYAEFSEALLIAAGLYTDVELAFWLTAPQPLLEMWTPIQLLARGEGARLLQVMKQLDDCVYV